MWRFDRGGAQHSGGLNGRCPERAAPTGLGGRCGWRAERPLVLAAARTGSSPLGRPATRAGLRWTLRPHTPLRFVRAPRTPPLAAIVWEENVIRDEPARTPPPFAVQTFALQTPFTAAHWLSRVDRSPFAPPVRIPFAALRFGALSILTRLQSARPVWRTTSDMLVP